MASISNSLNGELTVVIPAFNEAKSIGSVLQDVIAVCGDHLSEILVIDDGSHDDTAAIAAAMQGVRVVRHSRNRGYGASLKTGLRLAQTDLVATMDSDGQHLAESLLRLLDVAGECDMVIGQRVALFHSPSWRMPGKWLLGWMANYLTGQTIPDLNSGLRVMRRKTILRYIHLCPMGFSFSTTLTMALLMRGYRVDFVPITIKRRVGKSMVSLQTGLNTIMLIIRLAALFDPLRVFIPLGFVAITIGSLWEIPIFLLGRGISVGSMLAIMTGILLFALGVICDQLSQLRLERYEGDD